MHMAVVSCWPSVRSGSSSAGLDTVIGAEAALLLLEEMKTLPDACGVSPDIFTYTTVISGVTRAEVSWYRIHVKCAAEPQTRNGSAVYLRHTCRSRYDDRKCCEYFEAFAGPAMISTPMFPCSDEAPSSLLSASFERSSIDCN